MGMNEQARRLLQPRWQRVFFASHESAQTLLDAGRWRHNAGLNLGGNVQDRDMNSMFEELCHWLNSLPDSKVLRERSKTESDGEAAISWAILLFSGAGGVPANKLGALQILFGLGCLHDPNPRRHIAHHNPKANRTCSQAAYDHARLLTAAELDSRPYFPSELSPRMGDEEMWGDIATGQAAVMLERTALRHPNAPVVRSIAARTCNMVQVERMMPNLTHIRISRDAEMEAQQERAHQHQSRRVNAYQCAEPSCGILSNTSTALRKCAGKCDDAWKPHYCSQECQRKHWKAGHKTVCKPGVVPPQELMPPLSDYALEKDSAGGRSELAILMPDGSTVSSSDHSPEELRQLRDAVAKRNVSRSSQGLGPGRHTTISFQED